MIPAVKKILDQHTTETVGTDLGSEFRSANYLRALKRRGIRHFFAGASGKMPVVERWIRTMRGRIARYQYQRNSPRYIHDIANLLNGYNSSYHRSIGMPPSRVNEDNQHLVYEKLYGKRILPKQKPYRFKLGDTVRISGARHPFRREYFERWSHEVFKVTKRWRQARINLYKITDCAQREVTGSFYEPEMAEVDESDLNKLYRLEKAPLAEKTVNGIKMVLVQYKGMPRACAKWIPKKNLQALS